MGDDKTLKLIFELSLYYEKLLIQKNNPSLVALLAKIFGAEVKLELILDKAPLAEIKTVKTVAETHEAEKVARRSSFTRPG